MSEELKAAFQSFGFPQNAIGWLLDLWDVIQVFDDAADDERVSRADLDRAIWKSLAGLPANPFFAENWSVLLPVVANAILKWKASDTAEREGVHLHKAYMWRASYYDVVLQVYFLVHGEVKAMQDAHKVMGLYGETYAEYVKEFEHA